MVPLDADEGMAPDTKGKAMIEHIKNFFIKLFSEPDNSTPCVIRIFGIGSVGYGLIAHAYQTFWLHVTFDYQAFSLGLSASILALGTALGLKKDTQP